MSAPSMEIRPLWSTADATGHLKPVDKTQPAKRDTKVGVLPKRGSYANQAGLALTVNRAASPFTRTATEYVCLSSTAMLLP
jgi:hypothetical protein